MSIPFHSTDQLNSYPGHSAYLSLCYGVFSEGPLYLSRPLDIVVFCSHPILDPCILA